MGILSSDQTASGNQNNFVYQYQYDQFYVHHFAVYAEVMNGIVAWLQVKENHFAIGHLLTAVGKLWI